MAYVGDELPKPFSNLTEKSYVPWFFVKFGGTSSIVNK